MANTNRLREPGTPTVSAEVGLPSAAASSTRCVPREGRTFTDGSTSPAHTPVALTTARADTVSAEPDSGVDQPGRGAGDVLGADVGQHRRAQLGRRASEVDDQPGVVDQLAVVAQHAAPQPVRADRTEPSACLVGRDPARAGQQRRRRTRVHAQ